MLLLCRIRWQVDGRMGQAPCWAEKYRISGTNTDREDHSPNIGVDGRIICKRNLKRHNCYVVDNVCVTQYRALCCQEGDTNSPFPPKKGGRIFWLSERLSDFRSDAPSLTYSCQWNYRSPKREIIYYSTVNDLNGRIVSSMRPDNVHNNRIKIALIFIRCWVRHTTKILQSAQV